MILLSITHYQATGWPFHPGGGKGLAWFTGVAWGCETCSLLGTVAAIRGLCNISVLCFRTVPYWNRTESRLLFTFENKAGEGGVLCCVAIHVHRGSSFPSALCVMHRSLMWTPARSVGADPSIEPTANVLSLTIGPRLPFEPVISWRMIHYHHPLPRARSI